MEIGDFFGCWGDEFCGFDRPLWLVCKKVDYQSGSILNEKGEEGMRFHVFETDSLKAYSSWEEAKKELIS